VNDTAVLDAGEPVHEAQERVVPVERAGSDAADALGNLENARGHDVGELVPPRLALQRDAGAELVERAQGSNVYLRHRRKLAAPRVRLNLARVAVRTTCPTRNTRPVRVL